jgi:phosphoribosyl 1,2-cyclic phosphate phosphodiesterase
MKAIFLGTGTSVGVPAVGCECKTCLSADHRDKRLRASVLIVQDGHYILIDASTDFRQQALRYIDRLKPRRALLTHISHDITHADASAWLPEGIEIAYDGLEVDLA